MSNHIETDMHTYKHAEIHIPGSIDMTTACNPACNGKMKVSLEQTKHHGQSKFKMTTLTHLIRQVAFFLLNGLLQMLPLF